MKPPRLCLKCNHNNPDADMSSAEACPKCGAIYSRVEAHLAAGRSERPPGASKDRVVSRQTAHAAELVSPVFVAALREQSLYPTFRQITNVGTWLMYAAAVLLAIGGFFSKDVKIIFATLFGALFLAVLAKVAKEAALMLADLADASVIQAGRADLS